MQVYTCFCKEGYVRLNETTGYYGQGPCIKVKDCPNQEDNSQETGTIPITNPPVSLTFLYKCLIYVQEYDYCDGENEEYTIGSQCPQSCKNPSGVR